MAVKQSAATKAKRKIEEHVVICYLLIPLHQGNT